MVVALGFGLVVPLLPQFARSFDVSVFAATAVVSAFAGVRLASNLVTGALTDRIGTRRSVAWGVLIVGVSSAGVAVAPSYTALVVVRGLGGFGSALFFNALMAFVLTSTASERRGRAVGLLQGSFAFGLAFGPGVGGLLGELLGLRLPFAVYGVCCGIAGLVAFAALPRPAAAEAPSPRRALLPDLGGLWRDRTFVAALVMMLAFRWTVAGVRFSLVPLFASEVVGASATVLGLALTLAALTQLALVWPAGRLADGLGRRALAWPAFLLFGLVVTASGWATTVPAFLVLLVGHGIGSGLAAVTPPAIVGDVVPAERSGLGVGALSTAGDVGSVLGPLVCGWLADQAGYGWAFAATGALLALAGLTAFRMRETLPARPAESGSLPSPGPSAGPSPG